MDELTRDQQRVLTNFFEIWGDRYLAGDLGAKLTCSEAESIEELFSKFGRVESAKAWADAHAESDDPGDEHYRLPVGTRVRCLTVDGKPGSWGVVVDASGGFVVEPGEIWVQVDGREHPAPFDFDELEVQQ